MAVDEVCPTPFGDFELRRSLPDRTGTLRAWDGADLLLLELLHDRLGVGALGTHVRVGIVGDAFGALTVAVAAAGCSPVLWCDSMAARHAIGANLGRNELAPAVEFARHRDDLAGVGLVDVVLWKVDRSTDLVVDVLGGLAAVCGPGTIVLAAGMDKDLPPRTADILRVGHDVTTHRGRRKAHAFEFSVAHGSAALAPEGATIARPVSVAEHDLVLHGAPGVFSADRLDLGTRLLMGQIAERLPRHPFASEPVPTVIDLGCGNGALGLAALRANADVEVWFVDDSARAVHCARRNVDANLGAGGLARALFAHSDVFADIPAGTPASVDLVICNPPFHHAGAVTDSVALQMFEQSRSRLRPGAELWVVANRHLGYHVALRRLFDRVEHLASHPKYVLFSGKIGAETKVEAEDADLRTDSLS